METVSEIRRVDIPTLHFQHIEKKADVSINFKHLEAIKNTKETEFKTVNYPMSIHLGEVIGKYSGNAVVPFSVKLKTDPDAAVFNIAGEAYINGSHEDVESWVISHNEKPPMIWTKIYQESISILKILAKLIKIDVLNNLAIKKD